MMPMDPKKPINRVPLKRSPSALFSRLHKIHFADIIMVGFSVRGHILYTLKTIMVECNIIN